LKIVNHCLHRVEKAFFFMDQEAQERLRSGNDADLISQWLSKDGEWLLILDNADDDPDIVAKNIQQENRGNLLITSRNPNSRCLVAPKSWKKVEEMEEGDVIDLLLRAACLDKAKNIVKELHYLALAVGNVSSAGID
jgi:hypothetical protein